MFTMKEEEIGQIRGCESKMNPKVAWATKEIGKRLKGVSSPAKRKQIFREVWSEAKKKFG